MDIKCALLAMAISCPVSVGSVQDMNIEPTVPTVSPRPEYTVEETKYFDVPLSDELQDFVFTECEKQGVAPAVVIAIIERESTFDVDAIGDNGEALGLMQIHSRGHSERMDKLGCDNLLNPFENVTVGIDYLYELFIINSDLYWVLMAYNGGMEYADRMMEAGTFSDYAVEVSERAFVLERGWDCEEI